MQEMILLRNLLWRRERLMEPVYVLVEVMLMDLILLPLHFYSPGVIHEDLGLTAYELEIPFSIRDMRSL